MSPQRIPPVDKTAYDRFQFSVRFHVGDFEQRPQLYQCILDVLGKVDAYSTFQVDAEIATTVSCAQSELRTVWAIWEDILPTLSFVTQAFSGYPRKPWVSHSATITIVDTQTEREMEIRAIALQGSATLSFSNYQYGCYMGDTHALMEEEKEFREPRHYMTLEDVVSLMRIHFLTPVPKKVSQHDIHAH